MDKIETDAKDILNKLGSFSSFLVSLNVHSNLDECFKLPLEIMRETMAFDVSVLYEITNVVDEHLIVEIKEIFDPDRYRSDLQKGKKLILDMKNPDLWI